MHARLVNTMDAVFNHVRSYTSYVPTYASPWGFALGSSEAIDIHPDPTKTDAALKANLSGDLRMFDGTTLVGLLHIPAHLRRAIDAETHVYTLAEPPKFFGKGNLGATDR